MSINPGVFLHTPNKLTIPAFTKQRNTAFVTEAAHQNYVHAIESGLMQVTIKGRNGKTVILPNGQRVVEFINCSYLGLDVHPEVISAYKNLDEQWGVNFCCARSRFSIEPLQILEEELSEWYQGRAITFPSVTATHLTVMPLIASGILLPTGKTKKVRLIFDKLAHSSMQYLKPILQQEAHITTIKHNSIEELRSEVLVAKKSGETPVYIGDGIYSMGGICPVKELLAMAEELDFYLYLDDAHGTTIIGDRGEGSVLSQIEGKLSERIFLTFSLTKGFGAAGGGVLVSNKKMESLIRTYGQVYAFSAPLDFSAINACLAVLKLHRDGTIKKLQQILREKVELYDKLRKEKNVFSPIRMIHIGNEQDAIKAARTILNLGFFVSVAFFPIVARNNAQLRICIAANHTNQEIKDLVIAINHTLTNK